MSGSDPRARAVLDFWFGRPGTPAHDTARPEWFRKDVAFDAEIRQRFGALVDEADRNGLTAWEADDTGRLALIVVCDQFPRNLFRDDARAFALDPRARALAHRALDDGLDQRLPPIRRVFVYLPLEHSESLADQHESVRRFGALRDDPHAGGYLQWAERHRDVIERFGRFPHRNAVLGRTSTEQERAFLAQPGSRF